MIRKRFDIFLAISIGLFGNFGLFGQTAKSAFEVTRTGVVYDGAPSYQPGIVRTQNSSLLVSFMSGDGIYTTESSDDGLTWQKPKLVFKGASTELGMTALRNGVILWPFFEELVKMPCCEVRRFSTYVYRSRDSGNKWQGDAPITIPIREPIPYGHIVELPGGKLLMPIWGSFRTGQRWQSGVLESDDEGQTWGNYRRIAYDASAGCRPDNGFNETSIAELHDHTLVAIVREQRVGTRGHSEAAGPCDHYTEPTGVHFYRSVSHDLGNTWSPPQKLALIGTSPSLHVLKDGNLMLGYRNHPQHENDAGGYGLAVRISTDEGKTWKDEVDLKDPEGLEYSAKAQPGYPDFADLPGGDILVVFHSMKNFGGSLRGYIALNVLHRTM